MAGFFLRFSFPKPPNKKQFVQLKLISTTTFGLKFERLTFV
jgi:hypothetical protein